MDYTVSRRNLSIARISKYHLLASFASLSSLEVVELNEMSHIPYLSHLIAFYAAWAAFTSVCFLGTSQTFPYISPIESLLFVWVSILVPLAVAWAWAHLVIDETWTAAIAYDMRIFQIRHEQDLEKQLLKAQLADLREPPKVMRRTTKRKRLSRHRK